MGMIERLKRFMRYKKLIIIVVPIVIVFILLLGLNVKEDVGTIISIDGLQSDNVYKLNMKLQKIYENVIDLDSTWGSGVYTVCMSISDGNKKAKTFYNTSRVMEDSWDIALEQAERYITESNADPLWIRADICKDISFDDLPLENLRGIRTYIAQSKDSNGIVSIGLRWVNKPDLVMTPLQLSFIRNLLIKDSNDNFILSIDVLTEYLREQELIGSDESISLYDEVIPMRCKSWFIGEDDTTIEIDNQGGNFHHRYTGIINDIYARRVATYGVKYLMNHADESGKFDYNLNFSSGEPDLQSGYDIIRHAGVVWSLVQYYYNYKDMNTGIKMSLLRSIIDNSLNYLLSEENSISLTVQDEMLFIKSCSNLNHRFLSVGNNGLALVAIADYLNIIGNTDNSYEYYFDIAEKLANGIQYMLDNSDNKCNAQFMPVMEYEDEVSIITGISLQEFTGSEVLVESYYGGECALGLCKLYHIDKAEKWINLAERIIMQMIEHNTVGIASQWTTYSIFEYLLNDMDRQLDFDYYNSALRGVKLNNNEYYYNYASSTRLEQAMGGFLVYRLADLNNIRLRQFSQDKLLYKIKDSVNRGLACLVYPEVAMFSDNPQSVLGGFASREQGFRIRMDTIQHYILGYMLYDRYYKNLVSQGLLEVDDYGY